MKHLDFLVKLFPFQFVDVSTSLEIKALKLMPVVKPWRLIHANTLRLENRLCSQEIHRKQDKESYKQ